MNVSGGICEHGIERDKGVECFAYFWELILRARREKMGIFIDFLRHVGGMEID